MWVGMGVTTVAVCQHVCMSVRVRACVCILRVFFEVFFIDDEFTSVNGMWVGMGITVCVGRVCVWVGVVGWGQCL